ncbi:hypothetical protein QQP08_008773 [Theobroma cacao]|nr:hypothetical protein QQP08_008773 [Theobroma cacao]
MVSNSLAVSPQLVNRLAQQLRKEVSTVTISHLPVKLCYKPWSKTFTIVQKSSRNGVAVVPFIALSWLCPPSWNVTSLQPYEICNPFNQFPKSFVLLPIPVPLPYVSHLVEFAVAGYRRRKGLRLLEEVPDEFRGRLHLLPRVFNSELVVEYDASGSCCSLVGNSVIDSIHAMHGC